MSGTGAADPNAWMGSAPNGTRAEAAQGDPLIVNKRYRLVDPATGEQRDYTRVSTLLNCLGSSHGLTVWTERGIIEGLALRPDLRSLLASAPGDKTVADEVLTGAKEASGLYAARRHGTAVHGALERHLTGQPLALAPDEPVAVDLAAVVALIEGEGLRVRRIEQVILHETLGYAGRLDLLVEVILPDDRTVVRVADLKTGKDVGSGDKARKIAAQLAAYARATHHRLTDGSIVDAQQSGINVDTEVGYVIAVRDGVAELLEVDLSSGWQDVLLAAKEHQRAAAARKLAMLPVGRRYVAPSLSQASTQAPDVDTATLDALREAVTARDVPLVAQVAAQAPALPEAADEKTATGRAKPKCSRCRQPGHRARTCTTDVASEPGEAGEPSLLDATPTSVEDVVTLQRSCSCSSPAWHVPAWSARPDVTICATCDFPSRATVERLTGERAGFAGLGYVPPVEADDVATVEDLIRRATSQAELADIWQAAAAAGTWTDAHSALAGEVAPGLPPTSDLPF